MKTGTKKALFIALIFVSIIMPYLGGGCKKGTTAAQREKILTQLKKSLSKSMVAFNSDAEFDSYLESLAKAQQQMQNSMPGSPGMDEEASVASAVPATASAPADASKAEGAPAAGKADDTSITNVQEAGVDEGDIVKVFKNYLVVLRRGRLFTVGLKDADKPILRPVSMTNAYAPGFTGGSWYDEMLIYKNKIVVIGYSYQVSATEVGQFTISDEGRISHVSTHFIDSNDYYSSRNYASRLVGSKLIFYMPYYLYWGGYGYGGYGESAARSVQLPKVKKWLRGNEVSPGLEILRKTDIYKPVQQTMVPTLHTVAQCDLDSPDFACTARAVLGPYSRNFYVSPNAIYVWVSPDYYSYGYAYGGTQEEQTKQEKPASYVYMIFIDDMTARAMKAYGSPVDQFSFKEDPDGYLNVVVREDGYGDAMWNPEFTSGKMALIRTPLKDFSDEPRLIPSTECTVLPSPQGYELQNRFVGDYLLYGTGSVWYYDPNMEKNVYIKNYKTSAEAQKIPLGHSVDRIEVMGDGAVVIGNDGQNLKFTSFELTTAAEPMNTYTVENAMQGEQRSHGFFYKPTSDKEGILGLPVWKQGNLAYESAEILFLKVDGQKHFSDLGTLASKSAGQQNDDCIASCVDWYGNSRPIFLGGRIFALMGYELVEGKIDGNEIKEIDRLNFFIPSSNPGPPGPVY